MQSHVNLLTTLFIVVSLVTFSFFPTDAFAQLYSTDLKLDPIPSEVKSGEAITFSGKILTSEGFTIKGATIFIHADNIVHQIAVESSVHTDEYGKFTATMQLFPGSEEKIAYDIYAVFEGDSYFNNSKSRTYSVTVDNSSTLDEITSTEDERATILQGIELIELEKYDDAIFYFDKVLESNPNNTYALNNIAFSHYKQGYILQAVKEYANVLKIEPANEQANINLKSLRKTIPFVEINGFLEIAIYNSQNQLISYLITDKLQIIDGKDTDDFITTHFQKKTITYNDKKLQAYQYEKVVMHDIEGVVGLTELGLPEYSRIFVIFAASNQYPIDLGDKVIFNFTLFDVEE